MSVQQCSEQDQFLVQLQKLYGQFGEGSALDKIRAKAWDHFLEIGLPESSNETYRYIRLNQLYKDTYISAEQTEVTSESIAASIYPECRNSVIVFVNGYYNASLSNTTVLPKQMVVAPISQALRSYGAFLNNRWAKTMMEETDSFAILNAALHQEGVFIYMPPKTCLEAPIQILHVIDTKDQQMLLLPRVHIFAGAQAEMKFFTTSFRLSGEKYWANGVCDLTLEEGAQVHYTSKICAASQAWHLEALRATLKRDSQLRTLSVTRGSKTVRQDYRIALEGENASASLYGAWMLRENKQSHVNILMDHRAPHCRSLQLFKGVVDDVSRASFEGKIFVRQAAQKTDAFQLNNNLVLSDKAIANSKPNLEIFADDVKATHGATVGQLDQESLFYLRARGIPEAMARGLLIRGFTQEVIDLVTLESARQEMENWRE